MADAGINATSVMPQTNPSKRFDDLEKVTFGQKIFIDKSIKMEYR